ncbi:MAG: chaperone modulator CbpM [Pseudomonadales bacterium]
MRDDDILEGHLLDAALELSLAELARTCATDADWLITLVDEGILQPRGRRVQEWRFSGVSIERVHRVQRLQRDLGVNLAGSALILDMLEELHELRRRLAQFESAFDLDADPTRRRP